MAEKQITINQLAKMIKKGFDNTATKEQVDNLEKDAKVIKERLGGVEKRLENVEGRLEKVEENLGEVRTVLRDAHVL